MAKVWIALVDDWELKGNGLGNVRTAQYQAANNLMDAYEEVGVIGSFNVEVMQQLAFEKYSSDHNEIAKQSQLWVSSINNMISRGHDVQLHIHPQWHNATFDGIYWTLDKRWDISSYDREDIFYFVNRCHKYLSALISPKKLKTFRAGSWAFGPPSEEIIQALMQHDIYLDMSIVHGNYYDGEAVKLDYTKLECKDSAYYPDYTDIRKLGDIGSFVEIPTQAIDRNDIKISISEKIINRLFLKKDQLNQSLRSLFFSENHAPLPAHITLDPFGFSSGRASEEYIVDFSRSDYRFICKKVVPKIVSNAIASENNYEFLIFENHSKNLNTSKLNYMKAAINKIKYTYDKRVEFVSLGTMADNLQLLNIKSK